jgi:glycosyltransferase involved in cell wall biosynthesis
MEKLRAAFIQPIVDPVREAWFRQLAEDSRVHFRVFALSARLSHRPGWESRRDAGFEVEIARSLRIARYLRFGDSGGRTLSVRLVPLDLLGRLWRFRPHVIVVTNATEMLQAAVVRWVTGARIVLSAEDTNLSLSRIGSIRRWLKTFLLIRANMYCAHSNAARDLLLTLSIPTEKIASTPWAVDNERIAKWAAETDAPQVKRKLKVDGLIFVTVAALIPRKGIDQLLKAWSTLPSERREQASLLVVGDGPERQRLVHFAQAHGLAEVRFVGHLPPSEVAACLAAADIFVLSTLEDVWGFVVNEAMATGLPILCSKYAGSAQLVRDGENGFVFDPLDPSRLSKLLCRLLEHPENLAGMGQRSREIIADLTIIRSTASLVEALYRSTGKICPLS